MYCELPCGTDFICGILTLFFWPQLTTCNGVKQKYQRYSWIVPRPGIVELYLDNNFHPECFIKSYTCKLACAIVHLQVSIGWWTISIYKSFQAFTIIKSFLFSVFRSQRRNGMTSLLVPACPATLARLTMWPHCWSNISGRNACDEIWDQELLFGGIFMFKTAPWSSKSEPARWPQRSSQSWVCTECHSLKISLKRDLASGVSSSAVPDTIPALFTRILTVPTWANIEKFLWDVPLPAS